MMHTAVQRFGSMRLLMFLKEVPYAHQKYSKNSNFVKYELIFKYSGVKRFLLYFLFFINLFAYLSHLKDSDHQTHFHITQR